MDKRLKQILDEVQKLPISSQSMNQCTRLIDSFLMNCNFETMKQNDHDDYTYALEKLFNKFRLIRGR